MIAPVGPSEAITSSIVLSCVGYGIPPPRVIWKYGDSALTGDLVTSHQRLVQGVHVTTSSLQLCPADKETTSGQYTCQVENGVADPRGLAVKSVEFDLCFLGKALHWHPNQCHELLLSIFRRL